MKIAAANPYLTKINNNGVGGAVKKAVNSLSDAFGNLKNVISTSLKLNITPNSHGHGTSWVYYNYTKKDNIDHTDNKASNIENNALKNDSNLTQRVSFATIHNMMSPWPVSDSSISIPRRASENMNAASQQWLAEKTVLTPYQLSVKYVDSTIASSLEKKAAQPDQSTTSLNTDISGKTTLYPNNELMNNPLFKRQAELHKR